MSEQTEHDPTTVDPGQSATGAASSPAAGAPISLDDATIKAIVGHPEFQGALQGVKDRRISKIEKGLGDVNAVLEQLNLTPEQKKQYAEIEQSNLIKQLTAAVFGEGEDGPNKQAVSGVPPASGSPGTSIDIASAYKEAGFDPNQLTIEDVTYAETFTDPVALKNALLKKAVEMRAGLPQPTAASMPPATGGINVNADGQAQLKRAYEDRKKSIRPGDVSALTNLQIEFRGKGLKI